MKYKKYTIPLLEQNILFVYCNGDKELDKIKQKKDVKQFFKNVDVDLSEITVEDNMGTCYRTVENSKPTLLYIKSTLSEEYLNETLPHEVAHCVYHLSRFAGFYGENEFNAYLHGAINRDFRKFIKNN